MTAAEGTWWQMQRRVLDEVVAEDFGYSDHLVQLARGQSVARRVLASKLTAKKKYLQVFGPPPTKADPAAEELPWPGWPREIVEKAILDLGTLVLLPGILLFVDRSSVASICHQLGSERYRWVIQIGYPWMDSVAPAIINATKQEVSDGLAVADLAHRAFRLGLRAMRDDDHAAQFLGRLQHLYGSAQDSDVPDWLPASAVAAYWRRAEHAEMVEERL